MSWQIVAGVLILVVIVIGGFLLFGEITVTMIKEEGKLIQEVNLTQMERLQGAKLTVYFSPEHRTLGKEVAQALEQNWRIIQKRLSLDLGRFGVVVVVPKVDEDLGGVRLKRRGIWTLWDPIMPVLTSPGLRSLQEADKDTLIAIYWGLAHEAMELNILKKLYHDPAARWIGDGLAEYVGYTITSELAPKVRDEMLSIRHRNIQLGLVEQGYAHYDLTKEFLVKIEGLGKDTEAPSERPAGVTADPGYGVALAFWLQIAQQHGEGVIREFWQRLSQRGFPNAKEAARILSELTGEDIWTKLQNMDLHEVLQTLERATGVP